MSEKNYINKTWKELVMTVTTGRNERGGFLWYDHAGIKRRILELCPHRHQHSLAPYLNALVRSGHLVRANKDKALVQGGGIHGHNEYFYRQTGKAFQRGDSDRLINWKRPENSNAALAHELWRMHRDLPRWFRRMMLE